MSSAAAIRVMLAKGLSLEEALEVVEAFEEQSPVDNRTAHARRQDRYRERKRDAQASQSVTNVTPGQASQRDAQASQSVTNVTPLARVEDNPSTKKLSGKEEKNLGAKRHATPRDFLLECLLPETADGVLAHRKAMRRPLTGRAAQLLAKGFLATADPNAAADMMIERGWQGFKPEWFDNERRSNGKQQQGKGKGSIVEAGRRLTARLIAAEREGELQAECGFREGDDAFRVLPGGLGKRS